MATYNFSFNSNLTSYLSNNDLYFRLNDSVFFPSMEEMDEILARVKTPKEACAIALMWGWVQTTSEFWRPIKDKSSMTDILARVSSLYTEGRDFFSPPPKEEKEDISKGIDMLWEIALDNYKPWKEEVTEASECGMHKECYESCPGIKECARFQSFAACCPPVYDPLEESFRRRLK
jgi:hypothetical protein